MPMFYNLGYDILYSVAKAENFLGYEHLEFEKLWAFS